MSTDETSTGLSAADLEILSALNDLHEAETARRAARIAVERAEDQMMRAIAVGLHEDVEHVLVTTRAKLHSLRDQLTDEAQVKTVQRLEEGLGKALTRMQRLVLEVRPPGLERNGLGATLNSFLATMKTTYGMDFSLVNDVHTEPSLDVQATLFRVAQEAIDNTRKYASATRVDVTVREYAGGYLLRVVDDGAGFDADATTSRERIGLISMRERAEVRDGWCQVKSTPGAGTAIDVWVPASSRYQGSVAAADPADAETDVIAG